MALPFQNLAADVMIETYLFMVGGKECSLFGSVDPAFQVGKQIRIVHWEREDIFIHSANPILAKWVLTACASVATWFVACDSGVRLLRQDNCATVRCTIVRSVGLISFRFIIAETPFLPDDYSPSIPTPTLCRPVAGAVF